MASIDASYECERCGCTTPEEVTGGWRCNRCKYQPPECTCYEMIGGHQSMCPYGVYLEALRSGKPREEAAESEPEKPATPGQ